MAAPVAGLCAQPELEPEPEPEPEPGAGAMGLTALPGELLELILCSVALGAADIGRVSCTCRRLRDACAPRGKVWRERFRLRWPSLLKYYSQTDGVNWLEEYKARHNAGLEARRIVSSFSKRFFSEHVPCDGFSDIETLGCPSHFFEDELMSILNMEGRKGLTWKYYAKKILYFLRQQNILKNLKEYLQRPVDQQSFLEGEVLVIPEVELQRQVLDAMNCVLYEQLKYKGNEMDYYNSLNSYIHQVLIRRTGIPISLSILYLTIARQLGVKLEPVNFPSHFLLRWRQGKEGSTDIFDYTYIDAFGKGKQLTVKECEYLIGHHVTEEFYGVVTSKEVLQRMVGNLLNLGKRESTDQSYQLLRDSLDLYLAMYPDNVQHLMLQARLYFHLGIWPEKVLDILQHIQALDPSQHGAVGYLVQHTLEHIERRKEEVGPEVKHRSDEKHKDVCFSIGLIMKHKRYGYNCVIYGWDPTCMMGHEWIRNMNVHSLPHGPHQPFYNVLVEDGSCRYAAQENLEYNTEPHEIPHPDIGRYFSEFTGTHYLANTELEMRYPEDLELTCAAVQKNYSSSKE
ncbi:F-box only protein 21 isoform X3 [Alligator mississippiensis]|uniref:F-box only protein 21 isoform X3 n=1 Tax=Alligator mississippiensis TaxID=8496 RepID=UPI002877A691|nr:F-box only protein 21 isoform X3 [Alligator mississippiensis]